MRSRRTPPEGVSLSPFLAVLICTIGALTVLLMLMSRHARMEALEQAAQPKTEQASDASTKRSAAPQEAASRTQSPLASQQPVFGPQPRPTESPPANSQLYAGVLNLRIYDLKQKRDLARRTLSDFRLHLSHVEDHLRQLKENAIQIKAAEQKIKQLEKQQGLKQEQLAERIQNFQQTLEDKIRGLQEAKDKAQKENAAFAVIPFEGRNQTRRQPIYLECRADGVVIQPFGIRLGEEDFSGPVGPSNPLASALRAMSEQIVLTRSADGNPQGTPYPLMLVRPEGIMYYYASRAALQEWEAEFGYELINADMELAFPQTDPRLGAAAEFAIDEARKRQTRQIVMTPSTRREGSGGSGKRYRLGSDGNIVAESEPEEIPETLFPRIGTPRRGGNPNGQSAPERYRSLGSNPNAGSNPNPTGRFDVQGMTPNPGRGGRTEPSLRTSNDVPFAGNQRPSYNSGVPNYGQPGRPDRYSSGSADDNSDFTRDGSGAGEPAAQNLAGMPPTERSATEMPNAPGNSQLRSSEPSSNMLGPSSGSQNLGATGTPGGGNLSMGQPRPSSRSSQSQATGSSRNSAPAVGGQWAAAPPTLGSIGVRKSIRVVVHSRFLQVLPAGEPIPFHQINAEVANQMVADVYAAVQQWGVAGQGMHWRPVLQAEVGPGAEAQFARLQQLLRGSGLPVEKSGEHSRVSRLPPIK